MLNKIKLQNFRKHVDREFQFGPGLNAIRGANEAGKTTALEGLTYFCFGSGALRQPLDEVVTYGTPVAKLRVDVELEVLGVTYTGYRGKSGAEVRFGNEIVTGQREVTRHFEQLFGVDAKTAGKLMFASQKSLAESLKGGPAEAGALIESLAGFDLFERAIEAVQKRRPCGMTGNAETRVATLRAQVVDEVAEDLEPLRAQVSGAEKALEVRTQELEKQQTQLAVLDVQAANVILADEKRLQATIAASDRELAQLDEKLAVAAPVAPTDEEIAAVRQQVEDEKQFDRLATLHAKLVARTVAPQWDKDLASLEQEISDTSSKVVERRKAVAELELELSSVGRKLLEARGTFGRKIATAEGRLIRETTCALCQKDLSDVPEVAQVNAKAHAEVQQLRDEQAVAELALQQQEFSLKEVIASDRNALATAEQYLSALNTVVATNAKVEQLYAGAADYIEVDRSTVPGTWKWTGPDVTGVPTNTAAPRLAQLEAAARAAVAFAAARGEQQERRTAVVVQRAAAVAALTDLPLADARETLELAAQLGPKIEAARAARDTARSTLQQLQSQLSTKEALAKQRAEHLAQVRQQLEATEKELADMVRYNLLIKKIREARPVIATKLWNIVLAGVSKYLSMVREEPSIVTRADGVFLCDGHPVAGLSGSGEDMLGLAARIALTRTFLPGVDFLNLDEPAAACSDEREGRMLGMLSTLDFGQIVLVTHSDLADAFADRIVNV
jgi:DNA repair exonuclease SbcCD ATPase subunit